jgi:glycerophosphoryl diester phosphodiesterase
MFKQLEGSFMERNKNVYFALFIACILSSYQALAAAHTKCIAHRGDNVNFLENSMEAIESAYNLGSDGIEFDIHHTKDDVAIVMHDKDLKRVSKSKPGMNCPLNEKISKLDYQVIKENCLLQNDEEIPTLEEVLFYLQEKPVLKFLEFKDLPSEKTLELVEYYFEFEPDLVTFISFEKKALELAHAKMAESVFWTKTKYLQLYKVFPKKSGPYGVNLNHMFMSLLTKSHFQKEVGVWTVDKPSRMKDVFKKGIHYLTTNDPTTCLDLKNDWP